VKAIQAVTYVLPKNENININIKDSYIWYRNVHGIQFPLIQFPPGERGHIFRTDFEKQNNLLLVEKKGTRDSVTGSIYHVKVHVEDKIDSTIISLVPTKKKCSLPKTNRSHKGHVIGLQKQN
jgi:hypothetical protein